MLVDSGQWWSFRIISRPKRVLPKTLPVQPEYWVIGSQVANLMGPLVRCISRTASKGDLHGPSQTLQLGSGVSDPSPRCNLDRVEGPVVRNIDPKAEDTLAHSDLEFHRFDFQVVRFTEEG